MMLHISRSVRWTSLSMLLAVPPRHTSDGRWQQRIIQCNWCVLDIVYSKVLPISATTQEWGPHWVVWWIYITPLRQCNWCVPRINCLQQGLAHLCGHPSMGPFPAMSGPTASSVISNVAMSLMFHLVAMNRSSSAGHLGCGQLQVYWTARVSFVLPTSPFFIPLNLKPQLVQFPGMLKHHVFYFANCLYWNIFTIRHLSHLQTLKLQFYI